MPKENPLARKLTAPKVKKSIVRVAIELPEEIVEAYTDSDEMAKRLTKCAAHDAVKGIYFTDADRQALELILDANFASPAEIIKKVKRLAEINVGDITIPLEPKQIERIQSRCFHGVTFPEKVKEMVTYGINASVGLI